MKQQSRTTAILQVYHQLLGDESGNIGTNEQYYNFEKYSDSLEEPVKKKINLESQDSLPYDPFLGGRVARVLVYNASDFGAQLLLNDAPLTLLPPREFVVVCPTEGDISFQGEGAKLVVVAYPVA